MTEQIRIIVGVTGASGSVYGWRLLEKLRANPAVEIHLIVSRSGERTLHLEMGKQMADFRALAHCSYPIEDIGCRLASGSFQTSGMVIAPCSIHTMSAIAAGISSNLMIRAADVILKERRRLILMVRESPLHLGHLRSMTALAEMGAILAPPVPAFYHKPTSVSEIVEHSVDRVLDLLGFPSPDAQRWDGRAQMKVAFQGELGAFSQQAISQLLGAKARPHPCQRFDEVYTALDAGQVDAAVVPIENTLHGSIHENYDLLLKHDFVITGETSVRVVHNLIAPPGLTLRQVRKVYSHPVAINQCLDFFTSHKSIEREPFYDTAGSVKMLMIERIPQAAAIASEMAARIYGARILKRGIEDDRQNYTRFFLLESAGAKARQTPASRRKPWKTSLVFSMRNIPGALFRALSALALRDLNLVKIESRPLRGKPWEYLFYLDLIGRKTDPAVEKALGHLAEVADFLRVLGSYRAA